MFKNERNSTNDGSHGLHNVDQLDHSTSFHHFLLFYYQYNRSSGKTCYKMCRKNRALFVCYFDMKTLKFAWPGNFCARKFFSVSRKFMINIRNIIKIKWFLFLFFIVKLS